MTEETGDIDVTRGPRRLLALLLILALVAAAGALALSLRDRSPEKAELPPLFASTFSDATFLTGKAHLTASRDAPAGSRRLPDGIALSTGGTAYVVARCDSGKVTVRAGALTSSRPCTGRPVGVVALQMGSRAQLTATVSEPQSQRWGIAIYR